MWWCAFVVVCALCLAQPALGAGLRGYQLQIFPGPPGSTSSLLGLSDDGTAVGQRLLASGKSHALISSPRRLLGASPLAGRQSALQAIDPQNEMAGWVGVNGGNNPLFLRAGRATALAMAGVANAIASGPLIAVTATGADGLQHALVWNPRSASVHDLGPGIARGITIAGLVVGRTLTGQAAYWTPDGVQHLLGFAGTLLHVNLFGLVVGYRTVAGGPKPILLDIRRPTVVMPLTLPRGWSFGSAKDISDSGLIVGDAFKTPAATVSEGILWKSATKPVPLQTLLRGHIPRGVQMADASSVDINGLIVGSVKRTVGPAGDGAAPAQAQTEEDAFVSTPPVDTKFRNLIRWFKDADLDQLIGFDPNPLYHQVITQLHDVIHAQRALDRHHRGEACQTLKDTRATLVSFAKRDRNVAGEGIASIDELSGELAC